MRPKILSHIIGGTLTAVKVVEAENVSNIAQVIPLSCCPSGTHKSLAALVDLLNRIDHLEVARLFSQVLNSCYRNLVRAQGGWKYHHAFPGGLLIHTVRTAIEAERQAMVIYPNDRTRVDVIVAGAIFHDLGKAIQIIRGPKHPVRSVIPHAMLTLQILGKHLDDFGDAWPGGGRLLAEILVWLAQPQSIRAKGHDAEIIHHADILDVKADRASSRPEMITPLIDASAESIAM